MTVSGVTNAALSWHALGESRGTAGWGHSLWGRPAGAGGGERPARLGGAVGPRWGPERDRDGMAAITFDKDRSRVT